MLKNEKVDLYIYMYVTYHWRIPRIAQDVFGVSHEAIFDQSSAQDHFEVTQRPKKGRNGPQNDQDRFEASHRTKNVQNVQNPRIHPNYILTLNAYCACEFIYT